VSRPLSAPSIVAADVASWDLWVGVSEGMALLLCYLLFKTRVFCFGWCVCVGGFVSDEIGFDGPACCEQQRQTWC